jgi:hypothetical protein
MLASLFWANGQTKPWKQMELPSALCRHQIFTAEISKLTVRYTARSGGVAG